MAGGPYKFSKFSADNLATCDPRLQEVFNEAIKLYDFNVSEGHRPVARQQELYAQGRTKPGKIVTKVDGVRTKGMHNHLPSKAVDVNPWPIDFSNKGRERYTHLAGIILALAPVKGIRLRWGNDWNGDDDFKAGWDLPHFEVIG